MRALPIAVAMFFFVLAGCESETGNGSGQGSQGNCPSVGDLVVKEQNSFGIERCLITGTLTENATLPEGFNWYLDGPLRVDGGAVHAQLTIEKGVHIRGSAGEYIYITDQGSIQAIGEADNPIVMSANDTSELNVPGGGLWVGLIIENSASPSFRNRLEYVVVADAGEERLLDGITYQSNITVLGDNANTTMRFVQSHDANGDGLRLEGINAPNLSRLDWVLVTGAGRDAISYKHFSGLIKDLLVINRAGLYNGSDSGGRAGIFAAGGNSKPLIVNATLVGRDNDSTAPDAFDSGEDEAGIIFASDTVSVRLANVLILNYRNACYELKSGANLSSLGLGADDPAADFIDGLHCLNVEFDINDQQADWLIRSGDANENFAEVGTGNVNGANFYATNAVSFYGDTLAVGFTGEWYLQSIDAFNNGIANANSLNAYNDGDTSPLTTSDVNALPLIVNDCISATNSFYCNVDGTNNGFNSAGYDLTHIGAVRSSSSAQFNVWSLPAGGGNTINITVSGFTR